MWQYNYSNELYHHGVIGMKWGKRKSSSATSSEGNKKEKRHLGLDKNGNINLIRGQTTKKAKTAFAVKSVLLIASVSATALMIKHPDAIENGAKAAKKALENLKNTTSKPVTSDVFSNALGREMTIAEAFEAGFDLSD